VTTFQHPEDLLAAAGNDLGASRWFDIDQSRIDGFAKDTEDHQWIHVDPLRAEAGPFGTTIAHGYLTLSLAAPMLADTLHVEQAHAAVNYGLNKVRFPTPVPVGSRVRGHVRLISAEQRGDLVEAVLGLIVEIDGSDKPGCIAELVVLFS